MAAGLRFRLFATGLRGIVGGRNGELPVASTEITHGEFGDPFGQLCEDLEDIPAARDDASRALTGLVNSSPGAIPRQRSCCSRTGSWPRLGGWIEARRTSGSSWIRMAEETGTGRFWRWALLEAEEMVRGALSTFAVGTRRRDGLMGTMGRRFRVLLVGNLGMFERETLCVVRFWVTLAGFTEED